MTKLLVLLALLLVAGVGLHLYLGLSLKPLDDAARANAPGDFLKTSDGLLHYRWDGPATGPVVVMVNGFSTPYFIFEQNVSPLTQLGYRVLRFDHFGRGWSDRPDGPYDIDFYDRSLLELLDGLDISEPVGLVGLSMGGPIVSEFAARHPERVSKVFMFVPAGLDLAGSDSLAARIIRLPGIGDLMWRLIGRSTLLGDPQYNEDGLPEDKRLKGDVRIQMEYRGYLDSLLSTLRNSLLTSRTDTYRALASTGLPVMAVFGEDDATVLPSSAGKLRDLVPNATIHMLEDADHGLNYKRLETANPLLEGFFRAEN